VIALAEFFYFFSRYLYFHGTDFIPKGFSILGLVFWV
jgi:hypothetical protein